MKKLLALLGLAVSGAACQHQAATPEADLSAAASGPSVAQEPKLTKAAPAVDTLPHASNPANAVLLTNAAVLRKFDLSKLWAGDLLESSHPAMDGFFGRDYRRISFVFTSIRRDGQQPRLYHVEGKNLFNRLVTNFKGTLKIDSLARLNQHEFADDGGLIDVEESSQLFSATATFDLQEYPKTSTAGRFTGVAQLDFFVNGTGSPQLAMSMNYKVDSPAQGAGVLYRGQWISYATQTAKPLLLANNVFIVAPEALPQFGLGERDLSFNPKYAKLGWNEYWANNEWWADSPKPQLSL